MSEENNTFSEVEMPDDHSSGYRSANDGISARYVVYFIVAIALVISAGFFWLIGKTEETIVESVPEIENIHILSRLEGEDLATDEDKLVKDGRGVMLHLVAYGYDKVSDAWYYYTDSPPKTPLPRLQINGEIIPREQVRRFDFFNVLSVVYWYKWEVTPNFAGDRSFPFLKQAHRTRAQKHTMDNNWWALADVRNDLIQVNYEYAGTVHLTAKLQVFPESDINKLMADITTEGSEIPEGKLFPERYHRITRIPVYRQGLNATYRAFFNLFAYQDMAENGFDPMTATERFEGGTSKSILIGAMRLANMSVEYTEDNSFLEERAVLLFDNLTMDEFEFFRLPGDESTIIPYADNGVRLGDILVIGDRYMVLAKNNTENEPVTGALTGDDLVLDAYNSVIRPLDIEQIYKAMGEQPLQVWRINSSPANTLQAD